MWAPCGIFKCIAPISPNEAYWVVARPIEPSLLRHADGVIVGIQLPKQQADEDEEEGDDAIQKFPPETQFGLRRVLVIHSRHQPCTALKVNAAGELGSKAAGRHLHGLPRDAAAT
ncbi:MAG: hypothetical protein ACK49X_02490 [Akkermansiaceae bacterium]